MRNNQTKQVSQGIIALALGGFLGPMGGIASADDLGETSVGSDRAAGAHIMNLRDVEMSVLIDDVSAITGYTFIVHPSVRGRVTVSSQAPLSTAEVFQVFLSTLRVHGFTAIPTQGGAYKVVPEQTASAAAGFVASGAGGDQFETTVISLRNFDAVEAAKMIKPLTNPQGQITASPRSNSVIIVDYAANIDRVRQVVGQLDQDRSSVVTVALNNMPAAEMAKIVNGLDVGQSGAFDYDVGALSVDSNNSIVLRGEASDVARVAEIVRQLDTDNQSNADTLKVIALKNADAAELAPILESLGATMAAAAAPDGGVKAQPTIAVHEPTNALVISADSRILRQLEDVVSDLDVRRAQVLVEAVIVELSDNTARELGVQFAIGGGDSDLPLVSSNFANSPVSLLTLAGAVTQDGFDDGA
ncbi:MAG: secretin N-terminal domain-containing protein, partial [Pseudomonadota bacterium]